MRKRVKLNSYEPLVRDKNMKFVTRSWYNKIFPFVNVKAQIPNRERGSGGDRNSLEVEANGQGSSNR